MARLECSRGWGAVADPETGDDVSLAETVPDDVALRLADHYTPITAVDLGDEPDEDAADDYSCGVNGCSRDVDAPDDTCWQH